MFKVTITKIIETSYTRREYQKVSETGNERDGKGVYDYVDAGTAVRTDELKVLEQTVEDLDLAAVIRAVNKL